MFNNRLFVNLFSLYTLFFAVNAIFSNYTDSCLNRKQKNICAKLEDKVANIERKYANSLDLFDNDYSTSDIAKRDLFHSIVTTYAQDNKLNKLYKFFVFFTTGIKISKYPYIFYRKSILDSINILEDYIEKKESIISNTDLGSSLLIKANRVLIKLKEIEKYTIKSVSFVDEVGVFKVNRLSLQSQFIADLLLGTFIAINISLVFVSVAVPVFFMATLISFPLVSLFVPPSVCCAHDASILLVGFWSISIISLTVSLIASTDNAYRLFSYKSYINDEKLLM